jgi:signal transduction histidine kinase
VLEYGKSEEPPPQRVRIPLAPAIAAAAEDAGLTPEGVRLAKSIPARLSIQADPDQLHRVLVNLMRNARQAIESDPTRRTPRKGVVRVVASTGDGACTIQITDDGPGIPSRLSESLFEPFVSGRASEGAGLGLAISRELAASHGGALTLVETGPTGTTFALRLPH